MPEDSYPIAALNHRRTPPRSRSVARRTYMEIRMLCTTNATQTVHRGPSQPHVLGKVNENLLVNFAPIMYICAFIQK